jgi:hypothetical protein
MCSLPSTGTPIPRATRCTVCSRISFVRFFSSTGSPRIPAARKIPDTERQRAVRRCQGRAAFRLESVAARGYCIPRKERVDRSRKGAAKNDESRTHDLYSHRPHRRACAGRKLVNQSTEAVALRLVQQTVPASFETCRGRRHTDRPCSAEISHYLSGHTVGDRKPHRDQSSGSAEGVAAIRLRFRPAN